MLRLHPIRFVLLAGLLAIVGCAPTPPPPVRVTPDPDLSLEVLDPGPVSSVSEKIHFILRITNQSRRTITLVNRGFVPEGNFFPRLARQDPLPLIDAILHGHQDVLMPIFNEDPPVARTLRPGDFTEFDFRDISSWIYYTRDNDLNAPYAGGWFLRVLYYAKTTDPAATQPAEPTIHALTSNVIEINFRADAER